MSRSRPALLALVAVAAVSLTACSHSAHKVVAAATATPVATPSVSPTPTPKPSPTIPQDPPGHLSGLPTKPGSAVLAVKIENTANGRPQAGVNQADLVYVEQVEGGLTRLLAIYNSRLPAQIGPVRSARSDNISLLAQFGPIALAYSGAAQAVLDEVASSSLVNDSYDEVPSAYERVPGRYAPYNLFVDPAALLKAKRGAGARDIGMRFSTSVRPSHSVPTKVSVTYPAAGFVFSYDAPSKSYSITQDGDLLHGADGKLESTKNIMVQHIEQTASGDFDVLGNPTPANVTTGSGTATLYRSGHAYAVDWSRAADSDGTTFDYAGTDDRVQFAPGQTWIVLLPSDGTVSAS